MSRSRRWYAAVSPARPAPRITISAFGEPRLIRAAASAVAEAGSSFLGERPRPLLQVGGQLDEPVERLVQPDLVRQAEVAAAERELLGHPDRHRAVRADGLRQLARSRHQLRGRHHLVYQADAESFSGVD